MLHLIVIEQKRIAVALADTLNYDRAAAQLGITSRELIQEIATLEQSPFASAFSKHGPTGWV